MIPYDFGLPEYAGLFDYVKNLPFFYFSQEPAEGLKIDSKEIADKIFDLLPFDEFCWMNSMTNVLHVLHKLDDRKFSISDIYSPYKLDQFLIQNPEISRTVDLNVPKLMVQMHDVIFNRADDNADIGVQFAGFTNKKMVQAGNSKYMDYVNQSLKTTEGKRVRADIESEIVYLLDILQKAEERSQHVVRVQPVPQKRVKGQPKKTARRFSPTHHYVYIDCPRAPATSGESTGAIRRGHDRRAHTRILKHPRYKNHPKYGQKIRVKSAWIGPKEWVVEGKIYTLHENDDG